MMDANTILGSYGLAGLVIAAEASVIIYMAKREDKKQNKIDELQEQRIADARETRDKIIEPLEKQAQMSEQIRDILLNQTRRN